jgi:hypothetical protein
MVSQQYSFLWNLICENKGGDHTDKVLVIKRWLDILLKLIEDRMFPKKVMLCPVPVTKKRQEGFYGDEEGDHYFRYKQWRHFNLLR